MKQLFALLYATKRLPDGLMHIIIVQMAPYIYPLTTVLYSVHYIGNRL